MLPLNLKTREENQEKRKAENTQHCNLTKQAAVHIERNYRNDIKTKISLTNNGIRIMSQSTTDWRKKSEKQLFPPHN